MSDKPLTLAEVAALLYPHSEQMQKRYIAARTYSANVRRKVIVGKHAPPERTVARTMREAFP